MRTIEEVRRARLQLLLERYGSWAKLNDLTGKKKPDSTYSQISSQSIGSKSGSPKQMGSALARQLEEDLQLPRGWMDTDPDLQDTTPTPAQPRTPDLAEALQVVLAAVENCPARDELRQPRRCLRACTSAQSISRS